MFGAYGSSVEALARLPARAVVRTADVDAPLGRDARAAQNPPIRLRIAVSGG